LTSFAPVRNFDVVTSDFKLIDHPCSIAGPLLFVRLSTDLDRRYSIGLFIFNFPHPSFANVHQTLSQTGDHNGNLITPQKIVHHAGNDSMSYNAGKL
jgi:hypothetical protein